MSQRENKKLLYLAGGCFWGLEKALSYLDGVLMTSVGYANGNKMNPSYEEVCTNTTGFREAVEVIYDADILPIEKLVDAFFICIDPTIANRQGNDIGTQYQTGIYYIQPGDKEILEGIFEEKKKLYDPFCVELEQLKNFYDAEEYHQKYLDKNPNGYCHISNKEFEEIKKLNGR